MATRKIKPKGPTPVEAITHADKRANLPTADAHEFVAPETRSSRSRFAIRATRPSTRSSSGKARTSSTARIWSPTHRRSTSRRRSTPVCSSRTSARPLRSPRTSPSCTLFESFDGLDELDLVDFYRHDANWSNRMILGDSLNVMASLAEREALRGKVQMIYIDPPYGIKFDSNWQASARKRDVKDGKLADATREVEQIKAFRDTWELGIHSYLTYLRDRLMAARDLLTESGSCFVQIGDENVHLVRSLMDEVFGSRELSSTTSPFSLRVGAPGRIWTPFQTVLFGTQRTG